MMSDLIYPKISEAATYVTKVDVLVTTADGETHKMRLTSPNTQGLKFAMAMDQTDWWEDAILAHTITYAPSGNKRRGFALQFEGTEFRLELDPK